MGYVAWTGQWGTASALLEAMRNAWLLTAHRHCNLYYAVRSLSSTAAHSSSSLYSSRKATVCSGLDSRKGKWLLFACSPLFYYSMSSFNLVFTAYFIQLIQLIVKANLNVSM